MKMERERSSGCLACSGVFVVYVFILAAHNHQPGGLMVTFAAKAALNGSLPSSTTCSVESRQAN